jgi:hypothetical protein
MVSWGFDISPLVSGLSALPLPGYHLPMFMTMCFCSVPCRCPHSADLSQEWVDNDQYLMNLDHLTEVTDDWAKEVAQVLTYPAPPFSDLILWMAAATIALGIPVVLDGRTTPSPSSRLLGD